MRISTKGRYSLEALLFLALLPEGEYSSTRFIATNTWLSDGYLEQLFIPLRKAGIVQGIRGPQGGYILNRSPKDITVGDVLRAVEGSLEPVDCAFSKICAEADTCVSKLTWAELYQEINECINSITLADLVEVYESMDILEYTI